MVSAEEAIKRLKDGNMKYVSTDPQLLRPRSGAQELQRLYPCAELRKPARLEPVLGSKRSHCMKSLRPQRRVAPTHHS